MLANGTRQAGRQPGQAVGPDGHHQPVGWLRSGSGPVVRFTGWLDLIRVLEDELRQAPQPPGHRPARDPE